MGRDLFGFVEFPGHRRFVAASLIDAVGSGLLMPLTVLYFTIHVGLSPTSVGLGLTVGGVVALAFAPLGGVLIDSAGPKPALIGYWALAALAYAGYGLVHSWAAFVVAVTVAEIAASSSSTARKSLLAELTSGEDRVKLLAQQRALRNLGFGLGGLLASVALAVGGAAFLLVVYGDAITFLVAIALVARLPVPRRARVSATEANPFSGLRTVVADRRYVELTVLDFFATFHGTALEVALPLWIVLHTHAPRALTGILFTANTVIVVLAQVRATAGVRGLRDAPRVYRRAAIAMIVCGSAYLAAHYVGEGPAIALLVIGLILHTATEMLASAGEWLVSIELADDAHRGKYLSVFSLGGSLQSALGPTIVTSVLALGSVWLWPTLAALVCTGTVLSAVLAGRAEVTEPAAATESGAGAGDPAAITGAF
jgi:MFS family permease